MNINPSDGHNFGWGAVSGAGGWPVDGAALGTDSTAFTADFVDADVWASASNSIAIVRHTNGICDAAKVWRFATPGQSMYDYFQATETSPHQRATVTVGGPLHSVAHTAIALDPIFGDAVEDGDLVFNWWHANNGVRIAVTGGHHSGTLSGEGDNDDDTHGLGNEFGAGTNSGGQARNQGSAQWWHDVSSLQGDCHGGSCVVQGTDHGSGLSDGAVFGQYAIYVGDGGEFQCDNGIPMQTTMTPVQGADIPPSFS